MGWKRGRGRLTLHHGNQWPAPVRNLGQSHHCHGQRLLRQVLANHAAVAVVVLMPRATMLGGIVIVIGVRTFVIVLVMMCVSTPFGGHFTRCTTMIVQKRMTTANDDRHQGIAGGEQSGQGSAEGCHRKARGEGHELDHPILPTNTAEVHRMGNDSKWGMRHIPYEPGSPAPRGPTQRQ